MGVKLSASKQERALAAKIAERAVKLYASIGVKIAYEDTQMDVVATHRNGNPLRLADLLAADNFNFVHDITGINRHLNRSTGKLEDFFRPRFSA